MLLRLFGSSHLAVVGRFDIDGGDVADLPATEERANMITV
uniref:Uncharacterized protein n=1 Tax=Candidatus Kentrum sp. FM TaxID=2126340 RepID=A0A450SYM7_9GAMM|nr:MAG: hypothetical protein BECKFM1743A_GA0114220_102342 [Candidatus Kentron sp. FM]VFK17240.1 MAG: hypothetical protein BECKFM1743B_GA0114221_104685 [Candidatus Kentron sp. FM]